MITRQQLEIINRKTLKYPLYIAEKDYFLALTLQAISQSDLGKKMIFKGGTALHHCYLEQNRFSEDLDFSSDEQPVTLQEMESVFAGKIDSLSKCVGYRFFRKDHGHQGDLRRENQGCQSTRPLSRLL